MAAIATFIVCDFLCVGLLVAILTLLAMSGVPGNCRGLGGNEPAPSTNSRPEIKYPPHLSGNDRQEDDDEGLDKRWLIRRGDAANMAEKFCFPERLFYVLTVILM